MVLGVGAGRLGAAPPRPRGLRGPPPGFGRAVLGVGRLVDIVDLVDVQIAALRCVGLHSNVLQSQSGAV